MPFMPTEEEANTMKLMLEKLSRMFPWIMGQDRWVTARNKEEKQKIMDDAGRRHVPTCRQDTGQGVLSKVKFDKKSQRTYGLYLYLTAKVF